MLRAMVFVLPLALEEHAKSAHVAELLKKIGPLLDGEPTVKAYAISGE